VRSLNLRLLFALVVVGLVGAGAVYGLHRFQVARLGAMLSKQAELAEREGRFDDAARKLWRSVRLAPRQLEPYARLAELLRWRLGRPDEADYWMKTLVESNADSRRAHVLRGRYLLSVGRIEDAEADAARALDSAPDDHDALLLAAQCAVGKGQYDQAREYAARAVKLHPRSGDAYLTLAAVELQAGRRETALSWLRRGAAFNVGDRELVSRLATLLLDEGETQGTEGLVKALEAGPRPAPVGGYLRARLDYSKGRWLAASRGFERARTQLALPPGMAKRVEFWLGDCYGKMGNVPAQLAAYERAAHIDPDWVPARAGIATTLLGDGRIDEALAELRQLVKLPDVPAVYRTQLARALILKNMRLEPSERDWQDVETALDQAAQAAPEMVEVPIVRAETLAAQNRFEEAETLLRNAQANNPKSAELWVALAALAGRQENWEHAADLLDEAEQQLGDSVALRLARAAHLVGRGEQNTAESLKTLAEETEQLPEADLARLWRGLAGMALRVGDYKEADRLCRLAAEKEPNDLQIRLLMLDVAVRAGYTANMESVLREIQRIEGSGPLWHYGRAVYYRLLATEGVHPEKLLRQALDHLARAAKLRPEWSRVPLLAAEIHGLQGDEDRAVEDYLRAIDVGAREMSTVRRAISLLSRRQRDSEADQLLRRLEKEQTPVSADLARMASQVSMRLDDLDRALEMARHVADGSNEYRDHVWLAHVLEAVGLRAKSEGRTGRSQTALGEAQTALRHAVELAPTAPDAWAALVRFVARTGKPEKVDSLLTEIHETVSEQRASLVLAQCYEVLEKPEEAQRQCEAALAAAPKDPFVVAWAADFLARTGKGPQAEKQLQRIIAGQVPVAERVVLWARRKLAGILAARGGYPNLQQALDLIDRNLAAAGPSVEDQRMKAMLLASHPARTRRQEAIQILETVFPGRSSLEPEDRFVLARLHMGEGDWAQAAQQLKRLVDRPNPDPRYVAAYVEVLLNQDEIAQAESWLEKLEQAAPEQYSTAGLRAEAWFQRGRLDEAINVLKRYLENPHSQPKDGAGRLDLVATYLQQEAGRLKSTGQESLALTLLGAARGLRREYAEKHPEQELSIAAILTREGRFEEALELAERAWSKAEPATIARAAGALQGSASANPEQLRRIEAILLAALKKHDRPIPLLLALAGLHIFQERYEEAETLFREVIDRDGGNVVALNNLAVLLALQGTHLDEARRLIETAIERAGPIPQLLDSRATVYLALGQPAKALVDLDVAIAEASSPTWYFHKAQVHWEAGRPIAATDALARAHELGLTPELLNPLERPAHRGLQAALQEMEMSAGQPDTPRQ